MTNHDEVIVEALRLLDTYPPDDPTKPPAAVFCPPDRGSFLLANRDGFVKLAIASLRAGQGVQQKFDKTTPWFHSEDMDWVLTGLTPDEEAHNYLPKKETRLRQFFTWLLGVLIVAIILLGLIVGVLTVFHWIGRLF
jgi:hypothetical protein